MSSISRHPQGRHPTSRAAGLVDAVGGNGFVSVGAGAEVCFGSRPLHPAEGGAAAVGAAASAGLDRAQRCGRHPGTRSPSSQCACFGEQTATGPGRSAYTESDGTPDEKEGRPKHQPPGYQACMMVR